jgi:4-hydroxymandelate oxidase
MLVNPALTWRDIEWIRGVSDLPLVLKGILAPEDAVRAAEVGVDGVLVSNHGGRQVDGAVATFAALPGVVDAVQDRCEVYVDGGVRRGSDVVKALAAGARMAFIGRPVLWGLAADGESGVRNVLRMYEEELELTMAGCGCPTIADVGPWLLSRSG